MPIWMGNRPAYSRNPRIQLSARRVVQGGYALVDAIARDAVHEFTGIVVPAAFVHHRHAARIRQRLEALCISFAYGRHEKLTDVTDGQRGTGVRRTRVRNDDCIITTSGPAKDGSQKCGYPTSQGHPSFRTDR